MGFYLPSWCISSSIENVSFYNFNIVAVSKYDWNNAEVDLKLISVQSCWQQSFLSSVFTTLVELTVDSLPAPLVFLACFSFSLSFSSITCLRLISPSTPTSKWTIWRNATWPDRLRNRAKTPAWHAVGEPMERVPFWVMASCESERKVEQNKLKGNQMWLFHFYLNLNQDVSRK